MNTIDEYAARFAKIRTDISPARWPEETRHRAPHKPLLLLAVIDLFAEGTITENCIELSPDLSELFTIYWSRIMPPHQRGLIALPFFHLRRDGFWHLLPLSGKENILAAAAQIKSLNQLRDTISGARLDDDLYSLFCVEKSRTILRAVLIQTYFAPEVQQRLIEQGTINMDAFQYSQDLLRQTRSHFVSEQNIGSPTYPQVVRDQAFRRVVVGAYERQCAFCSIRVVTPESHTAVDAAHIVPWSISQNDDPRNGMALCRLCHWTFDEGLMTVSDRYHVITSLQLPAHGNIPGHLSPLNGQQIKRPVDIQLWPDLQALGWHRRHKYRRR